MSDYRIKQKVWDFPVPPVNLSDDLVGKPMVCIVRENGKTGICTGDESVVLIPVGYDNISVLDLELYLLVKEGYMGVAHIEYSGFKTEVKTIIPCEYDLITCSDYVYLKKDFENGSMMRVYFPVSGKLSDWYWLDHYRDEDYCVMIDSNRLTEIVLDKYGKVLFSTNQDGNTYLITDVFETMEGTVFVETKKDETVELIFVEKVERCMPEDFQSDTYDVLSYELTRKIRRYRCDKFCRPILSNRISTFRGRDFALAFVVEKSQKILTLNARLE